MTYPDWFEQLLLGAPLRVGPTGRLALALDHKWHPGKIFVNITAHIDEAGTHHGAAFMTLGAYVGRLRAWNLFDVRWKAFLKRYNLEYFHSADMFHRKDGYKWDQDTAFGFAKGAAALADDHTIFGLTFRLNNDEYKQFYKAGEWNGIQPDTRYGFCFRSIAPFIVEKLKMEFPNEKKLQVSFILEEGDTSAGAGDSIRIFKQLRNAKIPGLSEYLGEISFGAKKKFGGLQAADALASNSYQLEPTNPKLVDFVQGGNLKKARKTVKKKSPIFRLLATPNILTESKANLLEHKAFKKRMWEENRSKSAVN